ncbi:LysR family transcriptional regulator [Microbacterium sp. CFBP9034]|uniref:LysR family transcriptional regulator n=1 Tax=Microbacterium sp. CFBP9034 TaxID=3096540 RepID=UPI002A69DF8F|nr:LysR family transcriptional regulator [Microbacterium sp. CFBP9034]MDY0910666.1 LysR family transcriptional regulator [Microbacterium sp. CFBP9034]
MSHNDPDGLAHLPLWRTFLAVHASGSLSAAARTLGLTQPAVSGQLQALERIVGERLFVRGARGVAPTPRAGALAAQLAGPFDALAAALAGADPAGRLVHPPVRLGAPAELLGEVVAPALAPLVADGVRVQAVSGTTSILTDGLRAGTLDLAIASERPRGRAVIATPLVDETFVLVAAPALADAAGLSPERLADAGALPLEGVPLLSYAHDVPVLRRFWRHVFGVRLEREPALTLPDLRALRHAAIAGAGVTVLPEYLCRGALAAGSLVVLRPTDDPPRNTLFLVRRSGGAPRPHVERVAALLAGRVAATVSGTGT